MSEASHYRTSIEHGYLVAAVTCEKISEYEASILEKELAALAAQHQHKLVLNMKDVQMIASVGLGMLVLLNRVCKGGKGKLAMFNLSDNIRNVLRMTKLDAGLTICADQDAALKAVR